MALSLQQMGCTEELVSSAFLLARAILLDGAIKAIPTHKLPSAMPHPPRRSAAHPRRGLLKRQVSREKLKAWGEKCQGLCPKCESDPSYNAGKGEGAPLGAAWQNCAHDQP